MIFHSPLDAEFIPDKANQAIGLRFNSATDSVTIPLSLDFADEIGECLMSFAAIYRRTEDQ